MSIPKSTPSTPRKRKKEERFVRSCLFLASLLGGLGDFATSLVGLDDALDDTDGNGLPHVTDGETTKRRIIGESLNAHRLGWNHLDDGGVTRLDELGVLLDRLASTAINLLEQLGELAGNVGGVAVEHGSVASADLAGVVENDDLGVEGVGSLGRVILGVTGDVATTDLLHRDVLDVEADVVTRNTLGELLVVHLDGLDFGGDVGRSEGDDHAGLDDTGHRSQPPRPGRRWLRSRARLPHRPHCLQVLRAARED